MKLGFLLKFQRIDKLRSNKDGCNTNTPLFGILLLSDNKTDTFISLVVPLTTCFNQDCATRSLHGSYTTLY